MSGESLMMRALSDMASVQANVLRNGRIDQAGFCRIYVQYTCLYLVPFRDVEKVPASPFL